MASLGVASDAGPVLGIETMSTDGFPEKPGHVSADRWNSLKSAVEQAKLLPSPSGIAERSGGFGYSVSMDGNRALVSGIHLVDSGAAVVMEDSGSGWVEVAVLRPPGSVGRSQFGYSVSLRGDRALVAAPRDGENGLSSGSAYVFDFNGASWTETVKLTPADGAANDLFGWSVSLSGDRALVGAIGDRDNGSRSGSAYVFDFDGTSWTETVKLIPVDGAPTDQFGWSVSLSEDRALVGVFGDDDNGTNSGSAYVYDFNGTSWTETVKLTSADAAMNDEFGYSVSLSGDRALVGAIGDRDNGSRSGSAYVFDFDGTSWSETVKLTPTDGAVLEQFGWSVSLSGGRALVGTNGDNNRNDAGSAYVFDFDGMNWSETVELTPADGAANNPFGWSVSLSGDRALVGSNNDDTTILQSGSAYVFDFDGTSWFETVTLTPAEGAALDLFGASVSLSGDRALVGAQGDDDNGSSSGSVYVFDFDGTSWSETVKLTPADGSAEDFFGHSVSLSGDRALIGADFDDDNGPNSGSAYVFDFDGTSWSETVKLTPADGMAGDQFGVSVSLSEDRALIGASRDDDYGTDSGSAYIFDLDGKSWSETTKLTPADGSASYRFGLSTSLSEDRALVGARNGSNDVNFLGSAYVFDLNGTSWSETVKLTPADGADQFGQSISLSGDRAVIGADGDDDNGPNSGSAYVFDFDGTSWSETVKLMPADGAELDLFGSSVSLSGDRVLVGAYDDDNGPSSGSAYVFEFDGTSWSETVKLTPADGTLGDLFGFSVSLSGDRLLVGAPRDDDHGSSSGSAYVFGSNQPPAEVPTIPTMNAWGALFLIALMAALGLFVTSKRRTA